MKFMRFATPLAWVLLIVSIAMAADVPGSKDPPGFKRFQGLEIIDYSTRPYDRYFVATSPAANSSLSFDKPAAVEGEVTRLLYRVPTGHTSARSLSEL